MDESAEKPSIVQELKKPNIEAHMLAMTKLGYFYCDIGQGICWVRVHFEGSRWEAREGKPVEVKLRPIVVDARSATAAIAEAHSIAIRRQLARQREDDGLV